MGRRPTIYGQLHSHRLFSYELQVAEGFRHRGLGRFLVDKLVTIGTHWHMEKILLTVLNGKLIVPHIAL